MTYTYDQVRNRLYFLARHPHSSDYQSSVMCSWILGQNRVKYKGWAAFLAPVTIVCFTCSRAYDETVEHYFAATFVYRIVVFEIGSRPRSIEARQCESLPQSSMSFFDSSVNERPCCFVNMADTIRDLRRLSSA